MNAHKGQRCATVRVFVYGTLLSGEPNHRVLGGAKLAGVVHTKPEFELRDLGPFPALVMGGACRVAGEVYEVDGPALAALDRLESHPRFYHRSCIVLDDGTEAETYLLTPEQVQGRAVIASGDWRIRRKERT